MKKSEQAKEDEKYNFNFEDIDSKSDHYDE